MNRAQRRAAKARGELPRAPVARPAAPPTLADIPPGALAGPQTICLSMIVRNESHVIRRALASVRPFIHSWAVCDTGSTDGTQGVIRDFMRDIPGRLIERPWEGFATARNQALDLARESGCAVAMLLDADDFVEPTRPGVFMVLSALQHTFTVFRSVNGSSLFTRATFVRLDWPSRWEYEVHEALVPASDALPDRLVDVISDYVIRVTRDGAASRIDHDKLRHYLELARSAAERHPSDFERVYRHLRALVDLGEHERALAVASQLEPLVVSERHKRFVVLHDKAHCLVALGAPTAAVAETLLAAHATFPDRAEPLRYLARVLRERGERIDWAAGLDREADALPIPVNARAVDVSAYALAHGGTLPVGPLPTRRLEVR